MTSIYGSTMNDPQPQRLPNPSGQGGAAGGYSNGGGYNTEGTQRSRPTGFDGGQSRYPRWGAPQSGYGQPQSSGRPSTGFARGPEGATPNAPPPSYGASAGSVYAPQPSPTGQPGSPFDRAATYGAPGAIPQAPEQASDGRYRVTDPAEIAAYNERMQQPNPSPPVNPQYGTTPIGPIAQVPQPMPVVPPLSPTTATPDQLMSARFNIPGLTPPLGQPQPPLVAPPPDPRRLPAPQMPVSTYGGMFAR